MKTADQMKAEREQEEHEAYGRCSLCGEWFKFGETRVQIERQGCGQSQGWPMVYDGEADLRHEKCSDSEAVKAQAARIRDLVSENVMLSRQVEAMQQDKVRALWGTLNAVRVALKMGQPGAYVAIKELLPRMEEVLKAAEAIEPQ